MSLANNPSLKKPSTTASGSTDSPYLGSKISLVSKAKIRYEGILYTIDANESTVALSKVRSFGTEDRPTDRPVPARDEIFEYIIFRGADIEDLQVREPPQSTLTQDPAIVESSMYPASARSTTIGTNNNLGGSQTRSSSNQGTMPSPPIQQGLGKGLKLSSNADPLRQLNLNQQQSSRPFSQQSTSAQLDGQDYSYGNQRRGRQQQDYYNDFSSNNNNNNNRRGGGGGGGNQKYGYSEWPRSNNGGWDNGYRQQSQQQSQRYPRQQQQQNYEGNRFYPSRRPNNGQQSNGYYGYRERRNSTGDMTGNQQNPTRNNRQQRERADSIRGNSNNRSALKFIGDFDFEKSNAEFDKNAIEDEIKKSLSIKPTKDKEDDSSNTEKEKEKDNEQEQQQHQEQPPQQQQQQTDSSLLKLESQKETNPEDYYDKQKSFFDRISCETTEKEKTNTRRNWNEERRINAETFGLKYRPAQQGGGGYQRNGQGDYQRNGQGGYQRNGQDGYYNNNRRNNGGQQSYYGNGARYQRGGGGYYGSDQQQQRGGGGGGRNTTYYGNTNKRMQAY